VNLLLFTADELGADNSLRLHDQRLRHILEVHRASVGDSVRVGQVEGLMGSAQITSLDKHEAVLSVELCQEPPPKLPLTLVLALPRPKMLRRILRAVAEFGVAELHLINSYRVEKSFWQTPVLGADVIREYMLQGLQQARDTRLPDVHCHERFKPFAQDMLPGLLEGRRGLLAHPGDWPACPSGLHNKTLLIIGPEGGFIPYEVDLMRDAGCEVVSLGPRILRVENALPSLLGKLF